MRKSYETVKTLIETGNYQTAIRFAFSVAGPFTDDQELKDTIMAKVGKAFVYFDPEVDGDAPDLRDAINCLRMANWVASLASEVGTE